jgi:hypothetical protein
LIDEFGILAKRQTINVKKEAIEPSDLLTDKQSINVKKEEFKGKTGIDHLYEHFLRK